MRLSYMTLPASYTFIKKIRRGAEIKEKFNNKQRGLLNYFV